MNTTDGPTMAVSPKRKSRYERVPDPTLHLTSGSLSALAAIAELEPVSTPQLAAYLQVSHKAATRFCRRLFDLGQITVVAVPRALLANPAGANSRALAFGSSPTIAVLARTGQQLLLEQGLLDAPRPLKQYGPHNGLRLAHVLWLTDLRLWFLQAARQTTDEALLSWRQDAAAAIDLQRAIPPKQVVPDAWAVYRVGEQFLSTALEADRGTERGGAGRWLQKVKAYEELFRGGRLKEATGFANARLLIVTPGPLRRDNLARFLAEQSPILTERAWLAERSVLATASLREPSWRRPGKSELFPLLERASG